MSRHVVIGTAGHVDHGKTALVRALTGVDTDRWAEEKRRGITIDLGFAPLDLGDGIRASVVDVPGHEDFVRNMVAGATGVDVALLVIAADEGVMPQTSEHLAILEFLGVRRGVVALTKADLVDTEWLELVRSDVAVRMDESSIDWSDLVVVSAPEGRGIDDLRSALRRAGSEAPARRDRDLFRLPIDRVFTIQGTGTVVTGTVWSGSVQTGDEVVVLPERIAARVRGIQVHGAVRRSADPGARTALALAGVDRDAIGRGSTVVTHAAWVPSEMVDVRVHLLPGSKALAERTRVRVHHGTAEVLARVTPADRAVPPGGVGIVRLRLESPLVARWGDRLILRGYSPVTTIGGGVVLDPSPPRRPRRPHLAAELTGSPLERVRSLARAAEGAGVSQGNLFVRLGISPDEAEHLLQKPDAVGVVRIGDAFVAEAELSRTRNAIFTELEHYHEKHPHEPGMPFEAIRARIGTVDAVIDAAARALEGEGRIVIEGAVVRLAGHVPRLEGAPAGAAAGVRDVLVRAGYEGITAGEAAERAGTTVTDVELVLRYFVRDGTATLVGRDRYYDAEVAARLVSLVLEMAGESAGASPAQVRGVTGLTRKYLIPFLEWMDRQGFTVRDGDRRRTGPKAAEATLTKPPVRT